MNLLCNTQQIRQADATMIQGLGFPSLLLMETAGRKAAEWMLSHHPDHILYYVLAGPGNNGGDGLVIARYLRLAGRQVEILLSHDPAQYKGDAAANWSALKGSGIAWKQWPAPAPDLLTATPGQVLLIDALLGTGVQEGLRGPVGEIIDTLAPLGAKCIAIDLPSGLSADTGRLINPAIPAVATITFQAPKVCHHVHPAAGLCGDIITVDIGIWPQVMDGLGVQRFALDLDAATALLRTRPADGHKGTFGHALLVGGSKRYAGAIALSGLAALHTGAGLSTVFSTESARCAIYQGRPELMVVGHGDSNTEWLAADALPTLLPLLPGKSALALGPGLGNEPATNRFVAGLLQAWGRPLVLDADGINVLSSDPELWRYVPPYSILTPHPGEMARLMPGRKVNDQRLEVAEELAAQKQVIVVLKGAGTIIALPDGRTFVNTSGNEGMATGGAGDVLTGMLAGLLAQGYDPEEAACLGVWLHGRAGDIAAMELGHSAAVTASSISACIGKALAEIQPIAH